MFTHRFRDQLPATSSSDIPTLSGFMVCRAAPPSSRTRPGTSDIPTLSGFMVCPLFLAPASPGFAVGGQELLREAYEQVRAAARPSPLDRLREALQN
jgi:hypothetical protein